MKATPAAHELITGLGSTRFAQLHARISAVPAGQRQMLLTPDPDNERLAADETYP